MAKKGSKDYFGLSRIVSIILAIIPVTAWLLGAFSRFKDGGVGGIIAGIIRLIGGGLILWIIDIILMITRGSILRVL